MAVIAAFKEWKLLDYIAISLLRRCHTSSKVIMVLVGLTFVSAMFITNDIALITFVPLTIITAKRMNKSPLKWVVYETLAANLGSSFTPMGNPQNLFIYAYYDVKFMTFLTTTSVLMVGALLFLILLVVKEKKQKLDFRMEKIQLEQPKKLIICLLLFAIIIGSFVGDVDARLVFVITLMAILFMEKKLLLKVDYTLLLTFVGFFIFIGNLSTLPAVRTFIQNFLSHEGLTYWSSILLSQCISNVPTAMLLAPFTENWQELLLGVNVGGMGTLIASLASVISYKLFTKEYPSEAKAYFKVFTFYNLLGLLMYSLLCYIMI